MHGTLLLALVTLLAATAHAQDTLIYRNGQRIIGEVEEVGVERVKYRTRSGNNSILVIAELNELARVSLQGG
ncbi:MAG: hypothetical protein KF905_10800 [Flavobacteriales bacterium]|nr:hypothetical protein [Flavobacteriales bacterium]